MRTTINLLLWMAFMLSSLSLFLKLIVGSIESYGFNYFSAFICLFILLFSFFALSIKMIAGRFRKVIVLENKIEIGLFFATVCIMGLSGMANS